MTLAPTYLIYRSGFAPTNGTAVQMQRFWTGFEETIVHLMWDPMESGTDSVHWVVLVNDGFNWKRPFRRLAKFLRQIKGLVVPPWWRKAGLNSEKLARTLSCIPLRPHQAYVTCFNEAEAVKASALWEAVGRPPFVLHLFDLMDSEITMERTPCLALLVRAADTVLCLNSLIEKEAQRGGAVRTQLFPLVSDVGISQRTAPEMPLKILMSGALYSGVIGENRALTLIAKAWPEIKKMSPGAELHYSGMSCRELPAALRREVHDHGFLDTAAYQRLLRSCHVAYVPVPHSNHTALRFSMPSRIPDYLIQGLPVIACTDENTAIEDFFKSTPPSCTRLVGTADEFIFGVRDFAGDPSRWEKASRAAIDHAKEAFALAPARETLFAKLNAAGATSI
jgi:hypothetical protein